MAKLHGYNPSPEALLESVGGYPSYPGLSLLELKEAARDLGIECCVRKVSEEELRRATYLPAVAHFHTTQSGAIGAGHYVVLFNLTETEVTYLDPVSLWRGQRRPKDFLDQWSGHLLQIRPKRGPWQRAIAYGLISGVIAVAACLVSRCKAIRWSIWSFALLGFGVVLLPSGAAAWAGSGMESAGSATSELVWRGKAHDITNVSYALLRVLGRDVEYEPLRRRLETDREAQSLKLLADVCSEHGVRLACIRATPGDLQDLPLPAVLHLAGESDAGGAMALLVGYDGERAMVLQGGEAVLDIVSVETLRRGWTGHAAVVARRSAVMRFGGAAAAGAVLFAIPTHWALRRHGVTSSDPVRV